MHMHFDSSLEGYYAQVKFIVNTSHVIANQVLTFSLSLNLHFLTTFRGGCTQATQRPYYIQPVA